MKYVCQICGYIYDDDKQKVPFQELPEDWKCPLCGAAKSDFKPEEEDAGFSAKESLETFSDGEDLKELSAGQLAALCTNLARGCEKQYKEDEAMLFRKLGGYFDAVAPAVSDETVETVEKLLTQDIDNYPSIRNVADQYKDRGAARICVWGEKVTRMLRSLVNRYLEEGEKMLENTSIWICTVCGFVFVGDNPPEICPVCKVPPWKFEEIQGGDN